MYQKKDAFDFFRAWLTEEGIEDQALMLPK
jgi:hypothetical protein